MKILITGKPGVGKTTFVKKIVDILKINYRGFITQEIRKYGKRTGFEMIFLPENEKFLFASVEFQTPFKVGKYSVDVKNFEKFLKEKFIEEKFKRDSQEVLIIDEIGKMEMFSRMFKKWIFNKLSSPETNLIATVKTTLMKSILEKIPENERKICINLNMWNRENEFQKILKILKKAGWI